MHQRPLEEIIDSLLQNGKGILAADESETTAGKRLDAIQLPNSAENRRQYRELFLATEGFEAYISGVILHEETLWQSDSNHIPFTEILQQKHVAIGVKVDEGLINDPSSKNEESTKGIETLATRLETYKEAGVEFAKWRMVTHISATTPTIENIERNAKALAEYAKTCHQFGIVPIIEPEVLMAGSHTILDCERVSELVLQHVFSALTNANVDITKLLLKTSMVLPGTDSSEEVSAEVIAEATLRVLQKHVPATVPGIVFLSGGQTAIQSTKNLQAICARHQGPWVITFSFARAIQEPALLAWQGNPERVQMAREVFLHRSKMNSLARLGTYTGE